MHQGIKTTLITLTWFPVLYTFTNHIIQPYCINGFSMTPTFNNNDIVLVKKYNMKSSNLTKGDIIMFRSPENPEKLLTKRIKGLQNEIIIPKKDYPKNQVKIPRNHLWVEGDNEFHSIDSNKFGPISQGLVVGKVLSVIWPLNRIGVDLEYR
ncbi:unnamed protein product [Candida verbasci]|uniref:Mitochondrial inner membrane protease subunit n=1 Tax=Candida verbasci TaxID=1227364 RepID=A0A9W4U129_9ASCO|nr:unnamed protein product [Candida verbasci]